jgi:hypothetical protein
MNGSKAEMAGQTAGGGPRIHPSQLKCDQRERQILRPGNKSTLVRVKESRGDATFVKVREQSSLVWRPLVRIASAARDEPGNRSTRDVACGLDKHVQFIAVGETPHDLSDVIAGQSLKRCVRFGFGKCFHNIAFVQCDIDFGHPHISRRTATWASANETPTWLCKQKSYLFQF